MGNSEHLHGSEAAEKIKELSEKAKFCLFATDLRSLPLATVPMTCLKADEKGNLWFLSSENSEHNQNIGSDARVQLFFINAGSSEYLSVYGNAIIHRDREKIKELWTPVAKNWFSKGVDDPDLTAISVRPENGYYWDTKSGKLVQLVKLALGAVAGKPMDDGLQGKVSP